MDDRLWVPLALGAAAFALDLLTPRGVADGFLYILALLGALWVRSPRAALYLAALFAPLMLLGGALSPTIGTPAVIVLANRTFALVLLCFVAYVLVRRTQSEVAARASAERLRSSEERYRLATRAVSGYVYEWDFAADRIERSGSDHEMLDAAPAGTSREWFERMHPQDRQRCEPLWRAALASGAERYQAEYRARGRDGQYLWVAERALLVRDGHGRLERIVGNVHEIGERKQAEEALRHKAEELVQLMNVAPVAIWVARDRACAHISSNRAAARLFEADAETNVSPGTGSHPEETLGPRRFFDVSGRELAPAELPMQRAVAGERELRDIELAVHLPSGRSITLLGSATPLCDATGTVHGALGAFLDITERRHAEEHRELLMREFAHRIKNILAVVQSIAAQTRRSAASPEQFHDAFTARLQALARTHELLLRERWQPVALQALNEQTLAPYLSEGAARMQLSGPTVLIEANVAVSLSMVLHELATNAAKYGALSREGGMVSVRWAEASGEGAASELHWSERGGPPVSAPSRSGFGSRLLQSVSREFGKPIELSFEPEGLECRIRVPLAGGAPTAAARHA